MRTRSPGRRESIASAPRTSSVRSPLNRANRIENDVNGTAGGVSAATFKNACESVTTRTGGRLSRSSASRNSRSLTTRQYASLSSRSRIVWTCGRIKRPFGASLSIGTTRTTSSPGGTRSPTIAGVLMKSSGAL